MFKLALIVVAEPLLGTSVLEVLGLIVDPRSGEIRKWGPKSSYMLLKCLTLFRINSLMNFREDIDE
jgi:hypothetical protein